MKGGWSIRGEWIIRDREDLTIRIPLRLATNVALLSDWLLVLCAAVEVSTVDILEVS